MDKKIRTLSLDGGTKNAWWSAWYSRRLMRTGHLFVPQKPQVYFNQEFRRRVRSMLDLAEIERGDDVVLERFQYRPGTGANIIEKINIVIGIIGEQAARRGADVYLYQASTHKNAYNKHHPEKFPTEIIKRIGDKYGTWRPVLKRQDPNPHLIDALTLGCFHILRREGQL